VRKHPSSTREKIPRQTRAPEHAKILHPRRRARGRGAPTRSATNSRVCGFVFRSDAYSNRQHTVPHVVPRTSPPELKLRPRPQMRCIAMFGRQLVLRLTHVKRPLPLRGTTARAMLERQLCKRRLRSAQTFCAGGPLGKLLLAHSRTCNYLRKRSRDNVLQLLQTKRRNESWVLLSRLAKVKTAWASCVACGSRG